MKKTTKKTTAQRKVTPKPVKESKPAGSTWTEERREHQRQIAFAQWGNRKQKAKMVAGIRRWVKSRKGNN